MRDLAVLDSEGRRWMLGPEDGIWYRRENERWLQADPPRRLVCRHAVITTWAAHSFCVECGQRLNRRPRVTSPHPAVDRAAAVHLGGDFVLATPLTTLGVPSENHILAGSAPTAAPADERNRVRLYR